MGNQALCGIVKIIKNRPRGKQFRAVVIQPETFQAGKAELPLKLFMRPFAVKKPVGPTVNHQGGASGQDAGNIRIFFQQGFLDKYFPRLQALKFLRQTFTGMGKGKGRRIKSAG